MDNLTTPRERESRLVPTNALLVTQPPKPSLQQSLIPHRRPLIKAAKLHPLHRTPLRHLLTNPHRNLCRRPLRIPIHPRRHRRKRNRPHPVFLRQLHARAIAPLQQLSLPISTTVPHRPHSVENPPRRKPESWCSLRMAGFAPMQQSASFQQLGPGSTMNRSVHASTAKQRTVGSIDDSIHLQRRNVTPHHLEIGHIALLSPSDASNSRAVHNKRMLQTSQNCIKSS